MRKVWPSAVLAIGMIFVSMYSHADPPEADDSYLGSSGRNLTHLMNLEEKAVAALKSRELWNESRVPFREVTTDNSKPIYHGLKPEKYHHTWILKIPVVSESEPYIFVRV